MAHIYKVKQEEGNGDSLGLARKTIMQRYHSSMGRYQTGNGKNNIDHVRKKRVRVGLHEADMDIVRDIPTVKAGVGATPIVKAGIGAIPIVKAGVGVIPIVKAVVGDIPRVKAGVGAIPIVKAGVGAITIVKAGVEDFPTVKADVGDIPRVKAGVGDIPTVKAGVFAITAVHRTRVDADDETEYGSVIDSKPFAVNIHFRDIMPGASKVKHLKTNNTPLGCSLAVNVLTSKICPDPESELLDRKALIGKNRFSDLHSPLSESASSSVTSFKSLVSSTSHDNFDYLEAVRTNVLLETNRFYFYDEDAGIECSKLESEMMKTATFQPNKSPIPPPLLSLMTSIQPEPTPSPVILTDLNRTFNTKQSDSLDLTNTQVETAINLQTGTAVYKRSQEPTNNLVEPESQEPTVERVYIPVVSGSHGPTGDLINPARQEPTNAKIPLAKQKSTPVASSKADSLLSQTPILSPIQAPLSSADTRSFKGEPQHSDNARRITSSLSPCSSNSTDDSTLFQSPKPEGTTQSNPIGRVMWMRHRLTKTPKRDSNVIESYVIQQPKTTSYKHNHDNTQYLRSSPPAHSLLGGVRLCSKSEKQDNELDAFYAFNEKKDPAEGGLTKYHPRPSLQNNNTFYGSSVIDGRLVRLKSTDDDLSTPGVLKYMQPDTTSPPHTHKSTNHRPAGSIYHWKKQLSLSNTASNPMFKERMLLKHERRQQRSISTKRALQSTGSLAVKSDSDLDDGIPKQSVMRQGKRQQLMSSDKTIRGEGLFTEIMTRINSKSNKNIQSRSGGHRRSRYTSPYDERTRRCASRVMYPLRMAGTAVARTPADRCIQGRISCRQAASDFAAIKTHSHYSR